MKIDSTFTRWVVLSSFVIVTVLLCISCCNAQFFKPGLFIFVFHVLSVCLVISWFVVPSDEDLLNLYSDRFYENETPLEPAEG